MDIYLIILITILIINIKWILIFIYIPISLCYVISKRIEYPEIVDKILRAPYAVIARLSSGGWERYVLYQVGTIPSNAIRRYYYCISGVKTGKNTVFHFKTEIRNPCGLVMGDGCIIGDNAILDARSGLVLGKYVNLSSNVSIYTLQHDYKDPWFACNENKKKMSVEIDDRVWLGSNVIVLPGVHIGEGAVCCAGSVITKDVAPYSVVSGIPAAKVGERPRNLKYQFNGRSCWFY